MLFILEMVLKKFIFALFILSISGMMFAQEFDPPAGQPGSLAIHMDDDRIIDWASSCQIVRGPGIITQPDSVAVVQGSADDATGKAGEGGVVSLGDGGMAELHFSIPVSNGPGPDFAVFENSFSDTFLELAFVEVSSDGTRFFQFDAVSLTPTDKQVGPYGTIDGRNLYNLAGKYRMGYGTPFDLEELTGTPGLDISRIISVRVIDVVGTIIDSIASFDSRGIMVNDPWPTPFESGGFDLDAVGVLHNQLNVSTTTSADRNINIFPNPFSDRLFLSGDDLKNSTMTITDLQGRVVVNQEIYNNPIGIDLTEVQQGVYIVSIYNKNKKIFSYLIQKLKTI